VAADYDWQLTDSRLGRLLRRRVWHVLGDIFEPGQHLLELACGTGEDALWLARRGIRVTATDGSAAMLEQARTKATRAGVGDLIELRQIALQELPRTLAGREPLYDGVLSDLGGLNVVGDWRPLAGALGRLIRPGGYVVFVPMGPLCPWEIGWHLAHGQPRMAFRRWRQPARARVGAVTIPIWYPSARALRRAFAPAFTHRLTRPLGLLLPPSYLGHLVEGWPRLFGALDRWERIIAPLWGGWGDHYILVLERRAS
jgi:SAM-dependent methyltransferase